MISSYLQELILTGAASVRRITHALNSQYVISASDNKTNIITGIEVHPFLVTDEAVRLLIGSSGLTNILKQLNGSTPETFASFDFQAAFVAASTYQIQIRGNQGNHFFIIKPDLKLGTQSNTVAGVPPASYYYLPLSIEYKKRDFSPFIVFDQNLYISLNKGDSESTVSVDSAVNSIDQTAPAIIAPQGLRDDASIDSFMGAYSNQNTGVTANLKTYAPFPAKFEVPLTAIPAGFEATISEGLEFYNSKPTVPPDEPSLTWAPAGATLPAGLQYLIAPFIDFEIVTINEKSALRKFK